MEATWLTADEAPTGAWSTFWIGRFGARRRKCGRLVVSLRGGVRRRHADHRPDLRFDGERRHRAFCERRLRVRARPRDLRGRAERHQSRSPDDPDSGRELVWPGVLARWHE